MAHSKKLAIPTMPKQSLATRILHLRFITCIFIGLGIKAICSFIATYGIYDYPHLPIDVIETQLYRKTVPSLVIHKSKPDCTYDKLLRSTKTMLNVEVPTKYDDFSAKGIVNGSYTPEHCNPLFSVAVVVTYRNRQNQLDIFLPYMHNFLRKQDIHYKIYISEQQDERPWNKGALHNIGAKQAIKEKFPCLILHDVDLLPLDESNLYACINEPRHISASIDKFRYVLPYTELVGGVLGVRADQYVAANGYSNRFEGWGGEDDDFKRRLNRHNLNIVRYPRTMSRYMMMHHRQHHRNPQRRRIMFENKQNEGQNIASKGLDTCPRYGAAAPSTVSYGAVPNVKTSNQPSQLAVHSLTRRRTAPHRGHVSKL